MKKKLFFLSILAFNAICGVIAETCLPNGITFTTQDQIDSYISDYNFCTEIGGSVIITSNEILSLDGLNIVESIDGNLIIENTALTCLSGLENLYAIEGNLAILDNSELASLNGLDNLGSINGNLSIINSPKLTTLCGLNNINYSTITALTIQTCSVLSECNIQSICDFLVNAGTIVDISSNSPGCNNVSEIENACQDQVACTSVDCTVAVEDILLSKDKIQIFPNPTTGIIQIYGISPGDWELSVRTVQGKLVGHELLNEEGQIDISKLSSGLYFLELKNQEQSAIKWIVKE